MGLIPHYENNIRKINEHLDLPETKLFQELGIFTPRGPTDPSHGYNWCFTCEPGERVGYNKIVHYIDGYGWLGHAGHILEPIPDNEIAFFKLDMPGNPGRRCRLLYQYLRTQTATSYLTNCVAPILNKHRRSSRRREPL